jgi:hypothetical protein
MNQDTQKLKQVAKRGCTVPLRLMKHTTTTVATYSEQRRNVALVHRADCASVKQATLAHHGVQCRGMQPSAAARSAVHS